MTGFWENSILPEGGNHLNWIENTITSNIPSQNVGIAWPKATKTVVNFSIILFLLIADKMPKGKEINNETINPLTASSSVAISLILISLNTGYPFIIEFPKSPERTFLIQIKYWTTICLSNPSSMFRLSIC